MSSIRECNETLLNVTSNAIVPEGERTKVTVSHVINPNKFYVQREDKQAALNYMMDELFTHCDGQGECQVEVKDVTKGDLVAALYEDQSWYRARVEEVQEQSALKIRSVSVHA